MSSSHYVRVVTLYRFPLYYLSVCDYFIRFALQIGFLLVINDISYAHR